MIDGLVTRCGSGENPDCEFLTCDTKDLGGGSSGVPEELSSQEISRIHKKSMRHCTLWRLCVGTLCW